MRISKQIDATDRSGFARRIRPHVEAELAAAKAAEQAGDHRAGFRHLERAHVLGQRSTMLHIAVHVRMLAWGVRHGEPREVMGQIARVIGAAAKTWTGLVPHGNTGGADVSPFQSMRIPDDLAGIIATARGRSPKAN